MKYQTQFTVKQVCELLNVELPAKYKSVENNLLTNIAFVVNSLARGGAFFLYGKSKEDREENLAKALLKNPGLIIAGKASRNLSALKSAPHIIVPDPYDAMVVLSSYIRNKLKLTVVGVTGSLGKTTTKEMVCSVLSQEYKSSKSYGNRNNTKGIFNSLQEVEADTKFYVQEFGVAIGKKSMESKVNACLPNAAIITNISDPHLDAFGSKENILKEKVKLITEMDAGSPAFLNYDDPLLKQLRFNDHPIVSYALNNHDTDYYAENIEFIDDYITFDAVHKDVRTPVVLHSREKHNIANALAAMAVGEWFNMSMENIVKGLDSFRSEGIRQSLTNVGGYQLYVDCYNTAPVSLLGAVNVLERLPVEEGGKRIAVVGDIVRLGTEEQNIHREVGETIGKSSLDIVLCFGNENAKILADAIRHEGTAALYTPDREVLNNWMRGLITKRDVTLIKGPVARLLSKSIDQVFGTSYHVRSEHYEFIRQNDYQMDIIFEKEDHSKTTAALTKYYGNEKKHTVPTSCNGTDVFCIYKECFCNNTSIREVTVPQPIYNISEKAFKNCSNLHKVTLPKSLKVIGDEAFCGCSSLKEIVIPEGTIDIGTKALASCDKLNTVIIPNTVDHISDNAFADCPNLKIHCEENSYAHRYSVDNELSFALI